MNPGSRAPTTPGRRRSIAPFAALLAGCLWMPPSLAQEDPGRLAFERAGCDMCHGAEGDGEGLDPMLVPMTRDLDGLTAIVRQGFGHMPRMSRAEVSDADLARIHAWLQERSAGPQARSTP
jgi:mono/diheme cytochrome c family protein